MIFHPILVLPPEDDEDDGCRSVGRMLHRSRRRRRRNVHFGKGSFTFGSVVGRRRQRRITDRDCYCPLTVLLCWESNKDLARARRGGTHREISTVDTRFVGVVKNLLQFHSGARCGRLSQDRFGFHVWYFLRFPQRQLAGCTLCTREEGGYGYM